MSEGLDGERIRNMAEQMLRTVRDHLMTGPQSRDLTFEALNALAWAAAQVIVGTGSRDGRRETREFFRKALEGNIAAAQRHPPVLPIRSRGNGEGGNS